MTQQENNQNPPQRPSIKIISEIIKKIESLKVKKENLKDIPLFPPEGQEANENGMSEKEFLKVAREFEVSLSKDQLAEHFPNLDEILAILTPDDIRKKAAEGMGYAGYPKPTPEAQHLAHFWHYVDYALKEKTEGAVESRWDKHVQPLIDEIKLLLFPYWQYFAWHGTWRGGERNIIQSALNSEEPEDLTRVVKELERFKYKLQIESQQPITVVPPSSIPPFDTKGCSECESLKRLRAIDSNPKRDGILDTRKHLNDLKAYLRSKKHNRPDIAATLTRDNGRIKMTIPYGQMFLQK